VFGRVFLCLLLSLFSLLFVLPYWSRMGNRSTKPGKDGRRPPLPPLPPFVAYSCRVEIITAAPGVGKKTFLNTFMDEKKGDHTTTFGITHCKREIQGEEKLIKFGSWEGNADGVIVLYSITNPASFAAAVQIVVQQGYLYSKKAIMIVGNKEDLQEDQRRLPSDVDGLIGGLPKSTKTHLAERNGVDWFEISALQEEGVQRVMDSLTDYIYFEETRMLYIKPAGRGYGGGGGGDGGGKEQSDKEAKRQATDGEIGGKGEEKGEGEGERKGEQEGDKGEGSEGNEK